RLPHRSAPGGDCRIGGRAVGHVHALDVPARQLRTRDEREERAAGRPPAAGVVRDRAGDRRRGADGRVPEPVPAADRAGGGADARADAARLGPARPGANSRSRAPGPPSVPGLERRAASLEMMSGFNAVVPMSCVTAAAIAAMVAEAFREPG